MPDYYHRKCLQSAIVVAEMVERDDIVICLWSAGSGIHNRLFNLLTGSIHNTHSDFLEFYPERIMHPTSGAQIFFISMPNPWARYASEIRQGLQHLLTKMDEAHVRLSAHIWVDRMAAPPHEDPDGWDGLKRIFEENLKMEMNTVIFLSTGWKKVSFEEGRNWETKIQEALSKDIEKGLAFGWLPAWIETDAWNSIDGIIDLTIAMLEGHQNVGNRSEFLKAQVRVLSLQRELDKLCVELESTEHGQVVRQRLAKVGADQKKVMQPLLAQLDSEDLKQEEKEQLEKIIEEEYHLFLREFRGHFAEVRAMRIKIGSNLRDFYGLLEPKKKKRLGFF